MGWRSNFYVLLFGVVYRDFAMDPTASMHHILCKLRKISTAILAMIRQAFGEESISRTLEVQEGRQVKSKVKSMLVIFFDIKGIVHTEFCPGTLNSQFRILL
jgi:hypothetical protein